MYIYEKLIRLAMLTLLTLEELQQALAQSEQPVHTATYKIIFMEHMIKKIYFFPFAFYEILNL
jgi:hypothetical protein